MFRFNYIGNFFDECKKKRKFIGTRVTEGYVKALNDLAKINEKINSGNMSEMIKDYISNLINKIISDIRIKLLSIRNDFFINELYSDNFYIHNLIYSEFFKLLEIFKNNFDEKYIFNIIIKISDMISQDLIAYHSNKTQ